MGKKNKNKNKKGTKPVKNGTTMPSTVPAIDSLSGSVSLSDPSINVPISSSNDAELSKNTKSEDNISLPPPKQRRQSYINVEDSDASSISDQDQVSVDGHHRNNDNEDGKEGNDDDDDDDDDDDNNNADSDTSSLGKASESDIRDGDVLIHTPHVGTKSSLKPNPDISFSSPKVYEKAAENDGENEGKISEKTKTADFQPFTQATETSTLTTADHSTYKPSHEAMNIEQIGIEMSDKSHNSHTNANGRVDETRTDSKSDTNLVSEAIPHDDHQVSTIVFKSIYIYSNIFSLFFFFSLTNQYFMT
jgi:hypothetical protein